MIGVVAKLVLGGESGVRIVGDAQKKIFKKEKKERGYMSRRTN